MGKSNRPKKDLKEEKPPNKVKKYVKIGAVLIALIIFAGILSSVIYNSFEQIDYNEYGLKKNLLTNEIEEQIYEEGLYFIGIFYDFLKFPSTWATIEFSYDPDADDIPLTAHTKDGLQVVIETSFQFRLNKSDILNLYSQFGMDYKNYFRMVARSAIRDICGQFSAMEFYANRSDVIVAMGNTLFDSLAEVEIGGFQLRNIDLPNSFEQATEELEVARIDIEIAEYAQQAAIIEAQTLVLQAQAQANITIIEAQAEADSSIIAAQAAAEALNITLTQEGLLLAQLANMTGLNSTELLTYLWIQAILEHDSSYLIIGDNTPILFEL